MLLSMCASEYVCLCVCEYACVCASVWGAFTERAGFHGKVGVICLPRAFNLRNCPLMNTGLVFI